VKAGRKGVFTPCDLGWEMDKGNKIGKSGWLLAATVVVFLVGAGLVTISCTGKLDLSDYPKLFEKEVMTVVGKNATHVELGSAQAIVEKLQELTGNRPSIKDDVTFVEGDKVSYNLILVGTPNSNDILEQIYTLTRLTKVTEEYPGESRGILEISRSPWHSDKALLIVAGSDERGVKAACEMLTEDEKIKELSGKLVVTEFVPETNGDQIMVDMLNSVMGYIKQNHPDATPFIRETMSWTRSSQVISVGHTQYVYTSDGWTVTIGHAVTAEVIYGIRAEYNNERIVWVGMNKAGVITEKSYTKQ